MLYIVSYLLTWKLAALTQVHKSNMSGSFGAKLEFEIKFCGYTPFYSSSVALIGAGIRTAGLMSY